MKFTGVLKKMLTEKAEPIKYYLDFPEDFIEMNQLIGCFIKMKHIGNECKNCGLNKPIFRMGFCKDCFFTAPQANSNILHPELSTAHLGIEQRDLEWEKNFELQPHIVYLAVSGGLKVGVTRDTQIPTRWIDQGANQSIVLAKTNNRYEAGVIEVEMKKYYSDKTSWQRMLKNQNPEIDLVAEKNNALDYFPEEMKVFFAQGEDEVWSFIYPLNTPPDKVTSVKFDKQEEISGVLKGLKGQYLIFEDNRVLNIRSQEGKVIELSFDK